jgi:hypothetical protein
MGSISAPTFSSKPRMNANASTRPQKQVKREKICVPGRVSEYLRRSSHRSSSLCSLAKSIAFVDMKSGRQNVPRTRNLTRFTSPSRSMMSVSACLLFPMRPKRNTISGTRSRALQILYAFGKVRLDRRNSGRRDYLFKVIVITRAKKVYEVRGGIFSV